MPPIEDGQGAQKAAMPDYTARCQHSSALGPVPGEVAAKILIPRYPSRDTQPMIELIDFTKRYGELVAVDRLNLSIPRGELFGFIGPNGAGKTTTIRFLATLVKASSGEGRINGLSVTGQPLQVRLSIGYMPDGFGVYGNMTVRQFLEFFASAYGLRRSVGRQRVDELMETLGLASHCNRRTATLSRGMKQRLCLAKTLIHDPPVLILDEPSTALDPWARIELKSLLKRLQAAGKTILISSHVLAELADCCTSIGIIHSGKLVIHGPIGEVYRRIGRNRRVEIRFVENHELGLSVLRSRTDVRIVEADGWRATVEVAGDDAQVCQLLETLVRAGAKVLHFAQKQPTLQDVFMQITGAEETTDPNRASASHGDWRSSAPGTPENV